MGGCVGVCVWEEGGSMDSYSVVGLLVVEIFLCTHAHYNSPQGEHHIIYKKHNLQPKSKID